MGRRVHFGSIRGRVVGVVLAVSAIVLALLTAGDGQGPTPTSQPADTQPATYPASGPQAGSMPAGPATRPAWQPPVITARQNERQAMVRTIRGYGLKDAVILKLMGEVARHEFVPPAESASAYDDRPLPIGYGQTISQPYVVAEMTRQLQVGPDSRVLEIGTGSGYQAAALSHITPYVYSIEIVSPLAKAAAGRLQRLGYGVVSVRQGDGYHGWPEAAPFDAIIVTCSAGRVPPPLIRQLKGGGRMVIPVGEPYAVQHLMLIEKGRDGTIRSRVLMAVRFVPLLRTDPVKGAEKNAR